MDRIICSRLVPTARWVISTPTGGRVEPEVYCRCETSSMSMSTGTNARRPNRESRRSMMTCMAARERELGEERRNGVGRRGRRQHGGGPRIGERGVQRSAWPWSSGANNGTAIVPALIAAKNPAT